MQYTSADTARKRKSPRRSLRFRKPAKLCNRGPVNAIGARQLLDLLACPKCGGELERAGESFLCTNSACAARFGLAGGQPVLVDFGDSILDEQEIAARAGGSAIERGGRRGQSALARTLIGTNRAAAANADRFRALAAEMAERPKLLVVGGGTAGEGTGSLLTDPGIERIAFDIYASPLTQFIADAHKIPLKDESVDAVWIQAVLEHVLDPWRVVAEIHRVLRPGGIVYAETPFLQHVHEGAYDFTRFTESGHRWLFRNFEAIDTGVALGTGTTLLWSIEHLVRGVFRSVKAGVAARALLFWIRGFDRIIPRGYASDAASAVYFLGRKSNAAIAPRDMVGFYKGAHARTGPKR